MSHHKASPPRKFNEGQHARVEPPASAIGKKLGGYAGKVLKDHEGGGVVEVLNFLTKRKAKVGASWIHEHITFNIPPVSGGRQRFRNLTSREQTGLMSQAHQAANHEVAGLREEIRKLGHDLRKLKDVHWEGVAEVRKRVERKEVKSMSAMALQHRDEIEMMKTSLTLRENEVRRLKREVKIAREGQKKAADREAAARVQKDAALDMAEELKKAAVAARRDRNVMASNCKREKKRMAAVLKDTAQKCDAAIDQLKKQYAGAIEELEGAGCSAEEHFTNCKAEGKGRPYTYEF